MLTITTPEQSLPLRAVREAHSLSLRQVASLTGIDFTKLSRLERGQVTLTVDVLHRLAGVLGLKELERMLRPYTARKP